MGVLPPIVGAQAAEPMHNKNAKAPIAREASIEDVVLSKPTKDDGLAYLKESAKEHEPDLKNG